MWWVAEVWGGAWSVRWACDGVQVGRAVATDAVDRHWVGLPRFSLAFPPLTYIKDFFDSSVLKKARVWPPRSDESRDGARAPHARR